MQRFILQLQHPRTGSITAWLMGDWVGRQRGGTSGGISNCATQWITSTCLGKESNSSASAAKCKQIRLLVHTSGRCFARKAGSNGNSTMPQQTPHAPSSGGVPPTKRSWNGWRYSNTWVTCCLTKTATSRRSAEIFARHVESGHGSLISCDRRMSLLGSAGIFLWHRCKFFWFLGVRRGISRQQRWNPLRGFRCRRRGIWPTSTNPGGVRTDVGPTPRRAPC